MESPDKTYKGKFIPNAAGKNYFKCKCYLLNICLEKITEMLYKHILHAQKKYKIRQNM